MWIREPRDGGLKLLLREFFEVLIWIFAYLEDCKILNNFSWIF
jgi:hypothetical protein